MTSVRISKCFHTLRPGHLPLFLLCPYRFGDLDSLPDFVIVVALPGKCGTFFSFGVAIMSHVEKCGLGFALIYQLAVSRVDRVSRAYFRTRPKHVFT